MSGVGWPCCTGKRVQDEHFAYALDAVSASGVYGVPRLEFLMLCFWHADLLSRGRRDPFRRRPC